MSQIFLTDSLVRSATCPPHKQQQIVWDSPIDQNGRVRHGAQAGLGLRVLSSGRKAFVHDYRFNGKRKRAVLGDAAVLNVEAARLAARQRELEINSGTDPMVTQIDYRRAHSVTLRALIDEYHTGKLHRLSVPHQRNFRALIAPWLVIDGQQPRKGGPAPARLVPFGQRYQNHAAEQITPRLVMQFVNGITSDHQANAALRHLKALYNWALRMQLIDMRNPCDPVELRRVTRRRRDYTPAQIREVTRLVFEPVLEVPPLLEDATGHARRDQALVVGQITQRNRQLEELCQFMGVLLLTMARPVEVRQAEFAHFDLEQLIWHKHATKGLKLSRRVAEYSYRSVPIHPKVAEIVLAQRQRWPEAKYVFPQQDDPNKPRNNFHRALQRFKALPGVPEHFQLYDLKRIAISLMITGQGVSREAVSHYVDHRGNLETTLIYDLGLVDPLRPVTKRLGELLELDG
ncbi:MAG: DUF4102 domain-containing protein [Oricola sp.]|jgi:integrase|nr:MAG: DUF4102 domain-containing protein [Oricola sp.]